MKRNSLLDLLKLLASFGVVFGHTCQTYIGINGIISAVGTFAVPFFFLISGYFSWGKQDESGYVKKKVGHVFEILLLGMFLCGLGYLLLRMIGMDTGVNISGYNIYRFLIFNASFFFLTSQPLWFLLALIYCYLIFGILVKFQGIKVGYFMIPILLLGLFIGEAWHLNGIIDMNYYYRNFLFEGIPFFMLGHWVHENETEIKNAFLDIGLIIVFILGTLEIIYSKFVLGHSLDVYIGSVLIVFSLFVLAIKNNPKQISGKLFVLKKDLTMYIYVNHLFCYQIVMGCIALTGIHISGSIIAVITFILALFAGGIMDMFFQFSRKKRNGGKLC